jgi:hypothetical protein|tara:strand:+ start:188 stop:499 length:312 start_codon:yes stop_codon:yes gene_type:complete
MTLIKKTKDLGGKALNSLVDTSPKAFIKGIYNGTGKAVELGFVATGAMAELVSHTISSSKESSSTVGSKVKQNFTAGRTLAKEALKSKKEPQQQQEFDFTHNK